MPPPPLYPPTASPLTRLSARTPTHQPATGLEEGSGRRKEGGDSGMMGRVKGGVKGGVQGVDPSATPGPVGTQGVGGG